MTNCCRLLIVLLLVSVPCASAHGEVLVRWDQDRVPPQPSLGIASVLIPAGRTPAVQDAVMKGYRVYVEVEHAALPDLGVPLDLLAGVVVTASVAPERLEEMRRRLSFPARVLPVEPGGKWPHVRLNQVTLRNDVLQVSSASEQPWIESNAALVQTAERARDGGTPLLGYLWDPVSASDVRRSPALENYLVAIAEAGTFGSDVVLRLDDEFQRALLLGQPSARADWREIRRYLDFYAWDLPQQYQRATDVGVVTADAVASFEILNLLSRHNVLFEVIDPGELAGRALDGVAVVIVLDAAKPPLAGLTEFVRRGGTVVVNGGVSGLRWDGATPVVKTDVHVAYRVGEGRVLERLQPIADPDEFALEVRDILGPDRRTFEIWNGITIMAAAYHEPGSDTLLLTAIDYAHRRESIQVRVRGTFGQVHYEAPESQPALIPFRHRDGRTEFVLPDLRVGGRIFLSHARTPE